MFVNLFSFIKNFTSQNSDFVMFSFFIFAFIFFVWNQHINHFRLSKNEVYSAFLGSISALILLFFGFNSWVISFGILSYILYFISSNLDKIKKNKPYDYRNLSSFLTPKNFLKGSKWSYIPDLKNQLPKTATSLFLDYPRIFKSHKTKMICQVPKNILKQKLYVDPKDFQKVVIAVGAMGSGKSVFFQNILHQNKNYDYFDRQIIHDFSGEFVARFYDDQKDYIYNPFDGRSVYIDIWEEMKIDRFYGSTYMINILSELIGSNSSQNKDVIWEKFSGYEIDKIMLKIHDENQNLLSSTKWEILLEQIESFSVDNKDNRTKQSVFSYLQLLTKTIKILLWQSQDKKIKKLSLHDFLYNKKATIFLTKSGGSLDVLKILQVGIFGLYSDIMKKKFVNQESLCLLILDEFLSLNFEADTRKSLFTALRKQGNCMIVGVQHLDPKDQDIKLAKTSNLITLLFRIDDEDTISSISKSFGESIYQHYTFLNGKYNATKIKENLIDGDYLKNRDDFTHLTLIPSKSIFYLGYTPDPNLPNIHPEFIRKYDADLKLYDKDTQTNNLENLPKNDLAAMYQESIIALQSDQDYDKFIDKYDLKGVNLKELFKDFL